MHSQEKLLADYPRWHHAQVRTGDIDPVYPVLRRVAEKWDLTPEQRAWLVFCHVVWYHPGSTFAGFQIAPWPSLSGDPRLLDLPCLTERRGHRPKQPLINHLASLRETFSDVGPWEWVRLSCGRGTPQQRWTNLIDALMGIVGNGRWAAYKTAEMLQKICDLPITAPDAGHRYSSGPRKGLALLEPFCPTGNSPEDIKNLDFLTGLWADSLGEPDIAQVETSLCDFNSLVHGRYYLGHDIDSMQESFMKVSAPQVAWEARAEVFDRALLGEHNDWTGVRKDLNRLYRDRGELIYV